MGAYGLDTMPRVRRELHTVLKPQGDGITRSEMVRSGIMKGVLEAPALDLKVRGVLDVEEAFIDGSFAPAKKGALIRENKTWQGN